MNVMRWCLPQFGDGKNNNNNNNNIGLFTWQAQHIMSMSNYLCYLLTKQLDVTTNLEKPEKQFVPRNFNSILNEGENENKRKDIEPHHVKRLYGVMMTQMLITTLNGMKSLISHQNMIYGGSIWSKQSNPIKWVRQWQCPSREDKPWKRKRMNKMWQHKTQPSVATVWWDNNLVKTLLNYH